jgi:two-component system phosphate regulon sensor histidine kinase PhoR
MHEPSWVDVVSIIAHDLKTPITSARGYIELVKYSGDLNERQTYFNERALVALQQMEQLVARLLELAWIDADRPLQTGVCDLVVVIHNSVAILQEYAERRHITFHIEIDPDLGTIQAEENRLGQVVLNLLSNAIKYNRADGEVWVTAKGTRDNVEVAVRDTGVGIAPEDRQHIFDRFFRAGEHKDKVDGTGLGLSIVKSLVEKHGGQVSVESEIGVGTTFAFMLPRAPQLSEGRDVDHELNSGMVEVAEGFDFVREDNSNEELDAVDDNIQEPPQTYLDRDESEAAALE